MHVIGEEINLWKFVRRWKNCLHSMGLEISTGPVVPFRSREFLIKDPEKDTKLLAPLLWMNNISQMKVNWPLNNHKPNYIVLTEKSKKLLLNNERYVLLQRFSTKEKRSRLIASVTPDYIIKTDFIGIENHLNFIHNQYAGLERNISYGLAVLLNSSLMDQYFRIINGNTQVNAYDIRLMPLPEKDVIEEIGELYQKQNANETSNDSIDEIVNKMVGCKI